MNHPQIPWREQFLSIHDTEVARRVLGHRRVPGQAQRQFLRLRLLPRLLARYSGGAAAARSAATAL